MFHLCLTSKTKQSSFPRRRESSSLFWLDGRSLKLAISGSFSRLRGNDGLFGACFNKYFSVLFGVLLALVSTQACARGHSHNDSVIQYIAVAELPPEARTTLQLIKRGGPFPFPRDGVVFGNYEKRLPQRARGYYREYTVKTPGVRNRGARRIVCGQVPECYYSGDHYRTFQRIGE